MTTEDKRGTVTRTFVLEQSTQRVWETLVAPDSGMWLTPKAAYAVAPPEPVAGVGELRCCWANHWTKGLRQQTVWELIRIEPGRRLSYVSRTGPVQVRANFQLDAEGEGTRVELTFTRKSRWPGRLRRQHLHAGGVEGLMNRLIATAAGDPVAAISAQVMTWAPGIGAREQVNDILIAASPQHIWEIVDDKDENRLPQPQRLAAWRSVADGIEYRYSVSQLPGDDLAAGMARITADGPYRTTTINVEGVEVLRELLPHDEECLLRTTTLWTALIKANAIRAEAKAWLAVVKEAAEIPTD